MDAEGKPDPVLRAFARHLNEHLLIPSDGGGIPGRQRVGAALPGWFTYEPPPGVVWESEAGRRKTEDGGAGDSSYRVCGPIQGDMKTKDQKTEDGTKSEGRGQGRRPIRKTEVGGQKTEGRRRWVTSPGSCALGSRWRCWPPAASVPGRSRAAGPSRRTSRRASSSRPWCRVRTRPRPRSRTRKPSRCGPTPCPPARVWSSPSSECADASPSTLSARRNQARALSHSLNPQLSTLNPQPPSS